MATHIKKANKKKMGRIGSFFYFLQKIFEIYYTSKFSKKSNNGHLELSKNSIVSKSHNVNSLDTLITTERHFCWEQDFTKDRFKK